MVNTEDDACKELSKYDVKRTCQFHILPGSRSRACTCWALGHCLPHARPLSRRLCSLARGFSAARSLGPCLSLAFPRQLRVAAAALRAATWRLTLWTWKTCSRFFGDTGSGWQTLGSMSSVSQCRVMAPAQAFPSGGPCWDWEGCESEQENRYSGVWFSA